MALLISHSHYEVKGRSRKILQGKQLLPNMMLAKIKASSAWMNNTHTYVSGITMLFTALYKGVKTRKKKKKETPHRRLQQRDKNTGPTDQYKRQKTHYQNRCHQCWPKLGNTSTRKQPTTIELITSQMKRPTSQLRIPNRIILDIKSDMEERIDCIVNISTH